MIPLKKSTNETLRQNLFPTNEHLSHKSRKHVATDTYMIKIIEG